MKKKILTVFLVSLIMLLPLNVFAGSTDKAGYLLTDSTSEGIPFPKGTAGSENFRIPAFKVLSDGTLFAAADARYDTLGDGGGLDTVFAVSGDMGISWKQGFAIHYPDSEGYAGNTATTCIDPVIAEGKDGTVFIVSDMNPTGVTTAGGFKTPGEGTGYMNVNGTERLALTDDYAETDSNPAKSPYPYYLGDEKDGLFPVISYKDGQPEKWALDPWWNIYEKDENEAFVPVYQKQVNTEKEIQQNVFYRDSVLHVYNTGYMLLAASSDKGQTWTPYVLNARIKRADETALLVSPGKGTLTSDGRILIPFYSWETGSETLVQSVSFIWSDDNGKNWTRTNDAPCTEDISWCSESEIVELNDGVLRIFIRNGTGRICFIDSKWDGKTENYILSEPSGTDVNSCSACNLTANRYSEKIDGKTAIMVACPTGKERTDGKIITFLADEDNNMQPAYAYRINSGAFAYSCMDELPDGRIGILYETSGGNLQYEAISIEDITARGINFELTVKIILAAAGLVVFVIIIKLISSAFARRKKRSRK